ncbi:MAG TPA: rod shape-determining protein MreC [Candidatus Paceibacterota bacterium]|nr:rod shape-determining protein MreC [Candidatus Paceibacterota bacterium]
MKKTSLARRNAILSGRSVSWGALALLFAILALGLRLVAPDLFWQAFTPVFSIAGTFSAQSHALLGGLGDTAKLAASNETLASENAALASENQALQTKLADLSALTADKAAPGVLAGVVAHPPESPYDTLVLAAGGKEGVALGMEAFAAGGVPIGMVSSVLADFSRVTLFSAAGTATSGWVGRANIPLTVIGEGGGALRASVARAANIAVGDVVSVPGPGQLPIGSVVRIDSDPLSPAVTLRILPAANPFSIAWVELRATGVAPMTFATSTLP